MVKILLDNLRPWQGRPYHSDADVDVMCGLLAAGRHAANGCYYVHTGDLCWWLGYPPDKAARRENITLWETPGGDLAAWVLIDPDWHTFDVFIHPDWFTNPAAGELYTWAADQAARQVDPSGRAIIRTMWASAGDPYTIQRLERMGFTRSQRYHQLFEQSLAGSPLPQSSLPPGYRVRPVAGVGDVQRRAAASHAAFESDLPFDAYWPRYLRFMQSPLYPAGQDLVIEDPDGRVAAFCICWLDPINCVGSFEPLGVHPDFQRRGFGKAILQSGLRFMQAAGMITAIVGTGWDNTPAVNLYLAAGFNLGLRLLTYEKEILETTI